jgi:hypothetical protein
MNTVAQPDIWDAIHPQYLSFPTSKESFVVLPQGEFEMLLEQIEDWEDYQLYEQAVREDDGERIPMEEAFRMIEAKRGGAACTA